MKSIGSQRLANQQQILVSLGSNLPSPAGTPRETLQQAVKTLGKIGLAGLEVSGLYETVPIPASDQPNFLNCALKAHTAIPAEKILSLFKVTEKALGRQLGDRWSARTLDIDLVAYGDNVLPSRTTWDQLTCNENPSAYIDEVTVPHPRLHKRAFVLLPLMDIAPDWVHPCLSQSVREMVENADVNLQGKDVVKISDCL